MQGEQWILSNYLNKSFDTSIHKVLMKKLMKYGVDEQTLRWNENCLSDQRQNMAQRLVQGQ